MGIGEPEDYGVQGTDIQWACEILGIQEPHGDVGIRNKRDEAYTDVVKDGLLRLEDYLEGKLVYSKAPAGIALSLKNNAGWEEKSTKQLTTGNDQPLIFGWAQNAKDVIDTTAKESVPPKELGQSVEREAVLVGDAGNDSCPF